MTTKNKGRFFCLKIKGRWSQVISLFYLDILVFVSLKSKRKMQNHGFEPCLKACLTCLLCRRRNWLATNLRSSAMRANASTSVLASTVLVEIGRLEEDFGSKAHVRSSSPQKSPALRSAQLKKPVLPPLVVIVAKFPRIIKSISSTGSPSRMMKVLSVKRTGLRWSHRASISRSSIFSNNGT